MTTTYNFIHLQDFEDLAMGVKEGWYFTELSLSLDHFPKFDDQYAMGPPENWDHSPYAIMMDSQWSFNLERCRKGGHDWVETGYATPDSGYMGAECKMCGTSVGRTLY